MTTSTRFRPSRRAIALEPRILFDGAGAVAGADAFSDGWDDADFPEEVPAADASPSDDAPATLVIIDARVANHEILSADLPANIIVRVIGEDESGLAVTGEALANGHNGQGFDAVHIISHGTPGSLTLGSDTVNNETINTHSEQLQAWALHLTADADILLYGCDIAAGDEGEAFITELAHLTEADIAASIDPTGASDQGGNWTLESQTGPIEAGILFSEAAMAGFDGLLANASISANDDEPLSVSEPSELNEEGADTVKVDGWDVTGAGSIGVTIIISSDSNQFEVDEVGKLYARTDPGNPESELTLIDPTKRFDFASAEDAKNWLNSLVFEAGDNELGNTAITVTISVAVNNGPEATRTINITPSNDPVKVDDTTILVTEGSEGTTIKLVANDPEVDAETQTAEQIVYSLTGDPQHGYLTLDGERLGVGSIFTQDDIDNDRLIYVHTATGDAQNAEDSFTLRVNDGATPLEYSDEHPVTVTLEITPVNQLPTAGGGGFVYEGQPNNADDTGNVGQYIEATTGGDPQDGESDNLDVTLTSLTEEDAGGTLYFTGTATVTIDGVQITKEYVDHQITNEDIDHGFTFKYNQRNGLSYSHNGDGRITSDSFKVSVADQGGGTDEPGIAITTIELEVRPVDDDPALGNRDGSGNVTLPSLEAVVGDPDAENVHGVVITEGMLSAYDYDTDDKSISFIVGYGNSDKMNHGQLQLRVGTGDDAEWFNLPANSTFSMQDIRDGNVRYVQTSSADGADDTDEFHFKVVDNTTALRWNDDGSTYDRIGGIYEDPSNKDSVLKDHTFTINLTQFEGSGEGHAENDLTRTADASNSTYAGTNLDGTSKGTLEEGGEIPLHGTPSDGTPVEDLPYMSYTVDGINPNQIIYTFLGFSNEAGSSDAAGWLTKDGQRLNIYDTFTQADLDAGNIIKFHHDGDSEIFATKAQFSVSAGLIKVEGENLVPDTEQIDFTFYITPTNDAPIVSGSDSTIIKEGTPEEPSYAYITPKELAIHDPDDAQSANELAGDDLDTADEIKDQPNYALDHGESGDDALKFVITSLPEGGVLEYHDGEKWVEIEENDLNTLKLDANLLTTSNSDGASGLRFVNNGSEVRENVFEIKAVDRWDEWSVDPAEVTIFVTNVNDAPEIPEPGKELDPSPIDRDPNKIGGDAKNEPITVYEGGLKEITPDDLQAYDPDSSSTQVQYTITQDSKYGDIVFSTDGGETFTKLGVGSSFTQKDIADGKIFYVHKGGEENAEGDDYDDHFKFTLSDGDKEQTDNEFWIHVTPTNDAPIVKAPSGPIYVGPENDSKVPGFSVTDKDLEVINDDHEVDQLTVIVRLLDESRNPFSTDDYQGVTISVGSDTGVIEEFNGKNKYLVLRGTQQDIENALASLQVNFEGNDHEDKIYHVQVIADDRLDDEKANGGEANQPEKPGGKPGDIPELTIGGINSWYGADDAGIWTTLEGNVHAASVEIRVSMVNEPIIIKVPDEATEDGLDVYEDAWNKITFGEDGEFVIEDAESDAFGTPIEVSFSVGKDNGNLRIVNENGSATSGTVAGVDITYDSSTGTLTLTGTASAIASLLNGDTTGLEYQTPENVNHDLNGDEAAGDVTLTMSISDEGSDYGVGDGNEGVHGSSNPDSIDIVLNIIPVNDAPTVDLGNELIIVDSTSAIKVEGISIADVDSDHGYVEGEHDGIVQAIVRLLDEDGNPLDEESYTNFGIEFGTTAVDHGAESPSSSDDGVFTGMNGDKSALVLRGTLDQINAYLAGLTVTFGSLDGANVDGTYQLEVIADDRIRNEDGSLKENPQDSNSGVANGGTTNQEDELPHIPLNDDFNVYETAVNGTDGYNVYNVVSDTRELFVSSVNDPAFIEGNINAAEENDDGTVTLNGLKITDSDALPTDVLTVTVTVPGEGFTISEVGGDDETDGAAVIDASGKSVVLTGTIEQINTRLDQIVINLPDGGDNGLPPEHWHGRFDVTVVVEDHGNNGLRPESLPTKDGDDDIGTNETTGEFEYIYEKGVTDEDGKLIDNALRTTRTLTFEVAPTNDAPVLTHPDPEGDPNEPVSLQPVTEDTDGGAGQTVEDLFNERFSDPHDDLTDIENNDEGPASSPDEFWGIAIVGNESIDAQGVWQYWVSDTEGWQDVVLENGDALILDKDAKLRFNPADNFHGAPGQLTVHLIETNDNNDTSVTEKIPASGETTDFSTVDVGGTSRYSAETVDLITLVKNVNDRPTGADAALDAIDEDTEEPNGETVENLFGDKFDDSIDDQTDITGGDDARGDGFGGIAIVGDNSSPDQGHWQYKLPDGSWQNIGPVSEDVALTLAPDALLRFVPAENYNGEPGALDVRLSDEPVESGVTVNTALINADDPKDNPDDQPNQWSVKYELSTRVNPVNDAPTLESENQNEDGKITITVRSDEDTSVVPLLENVTVTDPDLGTGDLDENIFGAGTIEVKLTGYIDGDEVLFDSEHESIAAAISGTPVYDSASGKMVIELTDSATVQQVEAILEAIKVKYTHTSADPRVPLSFTVELSDGENSQKNDEGQEVSAGSGSLTTMLEGTITTNTHPVAEPDTNEIPEDTIATGNVLDNDDDEDGDDLTVKDFTIEGVNGPHNPGDTVTIPGKGTITINENGDYEFTPVKDWNGTVPTITYTVTDENGGTATSTLDITVTPVPDAVDDSISTETGMPVTFDPTENDKFSNPDAKITDVTPGNNGKVTITPDGRVTYTPDPGFEGTDTFTYTVTSGGKTETATVTVTVRNVYVPVAPPAFDSFPPPSQTTGTPGNPMARDVVRDTSVYFHDEAFDRVDRMQLPFHPIAYVNRQVQMSQDERASSDVRFYSNPGVAAHGQVQSTSIGAGLGADPNLFVEHAVRDTQSRADFLAGIIEGRLGRISLSSDRALPTPDLFEPSADQLTRGAPAQAEPRPDADDANANHDDAPENEAQGDADATQDDGNDMSDETSGAATDELALFDALALAGGTDGTADDSGLIGTGAPSFTDQLRGGSARLPATLFAPHKSV